MVFSKTPWHIAVTVLVLIGLVGVAFRIYRKQPPYPRHVYQTHKRAFDTAFAIIALIAFLTFDYVYEIVYSGGRLGEDYPPRRVTYGYAWAAQIAFLAAFVFLRQASRVAICAKICAGALAAIYTLALPWPGTITCAGALALFYAIDYGVVRPCLRSSVNCKRIKDAAFAVLLAITIVLVAFVAFYVGVLFWDAVDKMLYK